MRNNKALYESIMRDVDIIIKKHLNENMESTLSEDDVIDKYSELNEPYMIWFEDILYYNPVNGKAMLVDYDSDEYESPDLDDEYMFNGFFCKNGIIWLHSAADHERRFSKFSDEFRQLFLEYISDDENLNIEEFE